MQVQDIMTTPAIVARESVSLEALARLMLDHRIGCIPVVDAEGKLIGIVTESDFTGSDAFIPFTVYQHPRLLQQWISSDGVERIYKAGRELRARDVMRAPVITATADEPVTELVERMIRHNITRLPVVRDGIPIAIVARHDLLRLMIEHPNTWADSSESVPTPTSGKSCCEMGQRPPSGQPGGTKFKS